jgi:hypothetical protein
MKAAAVLYWLGWVFCLLMTTLLFLWHQVFYPFSNPGERANEGAVLFLMVMGVRWLFMAVLAAVLGAAWAARLGARAWVVVVAVVGLVVLHAIAGGINLIVWNAWLSVSPEPTPGAKKVLATVYFAIPAAALLILAVGRLLMPTARNPGGGGAL